MNMFLTGGSPHHPVSASFAGQSGSDVSYAHFSVIDTPGRERRIIRLRASHHQQWAALYRLVDTLPSARKKRCPFRHWIFSYPGATGFLASIRAGRRVGVENAWEAVPSAFTRLAERNVSVSRFR